MNPMPASRGKRVLRPHAPLHAYYGDESEREKFVQKVFDDTAADYDRIERLLALGSGSAYRRRALQRAGLTAGTRMLDVGIGTGLLAREAHKLIGPQGSLVGVDPSPGMMSHVGMSDVQLVRGRAESLPREDASADFLGVGYALRHIGDLNAALAEFHRVLSPGGRLLMLEITRPTNRLAHGALKTYMRSIVPMLARLVSRSADSSHLWRYYWDTIEACIEPELVLSALRDAGFADVRRHVELGIFSEYTAVKPA